MVIVESPAKARTIGRLLGRGYEVKASVGHVRDLLRSRLSVDVENGFTPTYRVPKEKRKVVKELQAAVKGAGDIYLATDPDREGEAIAWHVLEAAKIGEDKGVHRVVFHEITSDAVQLAFANPRPIDMRLVDAQQARRILDRLVGYQISPLLWRNVRSRLSAGRVQSVALRLIVEREREIEAFVSQEYWSIEAELAKRVEKRSGFRAKLVRVEGEEVAIGTQESAEALVKDLRDAIYKVSKVNKKEVRRKPAAPFITSTLQQEASRRLRFTAKRTMSLAQQLYEGVNWGDGEPVGLITYMRTDSVNVADEARREARTYIADRFGSQYVPGKPPSYKTRAKRAQEAHEAIRPTSVLREPEQLKGVLNRDQHRLYELIWKRFVASQMAPAVLDSTSVEILAGRIPGQMPYLFRAAGSRVKFPGFQVLYEESGEEEEGESRSGKGKSRKSKPKESKPKESKPKESKPLPALQVEEILDLLGLFPEQHFTQPPPRYTEASLVRTLEENGIGRPSTYAPILSTIQSRGYVERIQRSLHPTELGFLVNDVLVKHFPEIVDTSFTARMEANLDRIASGEREWVPVLEEFYRPFAKTLEEAEARMEKVELPEESTDELCEKCGSPMVVKWGRYGKFIACSNFPDCRNTKPLLTKIGVACPQCGGDLVERRTKRKRRFYGCISYPDCDFSTWELPVAEPCPSCGGLMTRIKEGLAKCTQCQREMAHSQVGRETSGSSEPG